MKIKFYFLSILFLFLIIPLAHAQENDSSLITLNKIFSSNYFYGGRFGPARWLEDGVHFTTLEPSKQIKGGTDIVVYDAATETRKILVPAEKLIPEGKETPLQIAFQVLRKVDW